MGFRAVGVLALVFIFSLSAHSQVIVHSIEIDSSPIGECLTAAEAWAAANRLPVEVSARVVTREVRVSDFAGIPSGTGHEVFDPTAIATINRQSYCRLNHHSLEQADAIREEVGLALEGIITPVGLDRILALTGADEIDPLILESSRLADPTHLDDANLWAVAASYRTRVDRVEALAAWSELASREAGTPEGEYARARLAGWMQTDGRREEARLLWEDIVANSPGTEAAGYAQYRLAYLDSAARDNDTAVARWIPIAEGQLPATEEQRLDAMLRTGSILHRARDMAGAYIAFRQLQQTTDRADIQGAAGLQILALTLELSRGRGGEFVGTLEDALLEYDRLQSLGTLEPYVACRADLMRHETNFYLGNCETALAQIAEFRTRHPFEDFRQEHLAADKFEGMALMRLGRLDEADAVFAAIGTRYTEEDEMGTTDPLALALLYRARICLERDEIDVEGAEAFLDELDRTHPDSRHAGLAADLRATIANVRGQSLPLPGGSPTAP